MSNNTKYVRDAFKSLELVEDKEFDLFGKDSFEELGDFIEDDDDVEVEQEVIDLDANEPEELKDSYVGDVILSCPVCHANMFKAVDDVVIDEETELCCVGDPCPVCGQEDGFKVIGKVAPFEESEEEEDTEVEVETEPDEAEVEVKEKVRESFKKRVADKRLQEKRIPAHRKLMEKVCKDCGKEVCECDKEEKLAKKPIRIKATGNMVEIPIEKKDRPLKEEKGDLNKLDKDIQDIVGDHFGYTIDFDFLDIVADVLLRIDDFEEAVDNDGIVLDTVDDTLIYIDDQWEVLRYYFDSPSDLDSESWDTAFTNFASDIEEICGEIAEAREGEEVSESKKPSNKGKKLTEGLSVSEVKKFLEDSIKSIEEDPSVTARYVLDDDLCLYVGYEGGFDADETGSDERICAKIAERNDYYWVDFEAMNQPWDPETGDVWDTDGEVSPSDAKYYVDEYKAIRKALNKGEVVLESKKVEGNKKLSESKYQIKEVSSDEAGDIINNRKPLGLFLQKDGNTFVAIDNSTGDAWTEEFKNRKSAEKWLLSADESLKKPNSGEKLTEAPIYDLHPQFDSRKSFYSKAKVDTGYKGDKNKLYSYGTLVAELEDGKPVVYGTFSSTTLRHIKDWLKQLGFKADNAKQIMADYGVKDENRSVRRPGRKVNESLEDIKSEWENMRSRNMFEFPSGDYVYVGIDFDKKTIYAGGGTNTGIFRETEIDLDEDDSLYGNLERLYDTISEEHPEYFETDESLKSDGKPLTESGKEQITVKWGDVFNERQQGRLASLKGQKIDRGTAEQISNAVASHLAKKNFELKDLMPKIDFDNETFICNVEKEKEMSLGEAIENATIETEDQVINLSAETKEEDMNADWFDHEGGELLPDDQDEEMIAPLDDEDIQEIEDAQQPEEEPEENAEEPTETEEENPEDEEEFEFDEIQEESFKRITESYLKKVYSNVRSFKINNIDVNENLLRIDGTIRFNSGKKKDTTFVFESAKNKDTIAKSKKRFVGLNETFTDKKDAFVLNTVINNKKFIAESLSYDYPAKTKDLNESVKTVKGIVK